MKRHYILYLLLSILMVASTLHAGTITYTYDSAGRLIKADYGGGKSITYEYDNAGNLTKKTMTTDSSIFSDVPTTNYYYNYILAIYNNRITVGCLQNPLSYCPSQYVTREQMAAFIIRAKEGEPATDYCGTTPPFNDVPVTNNFCRYIKRLKELNITRGCVDGNYCPSQYVTREQMAAFLARAFLGMQ